MNKDPSSKTYRSIGEVAKELDLKDKKSGKIQTHTIRYWETQFKQIKPLVKAGKRRYYSEKDVEIIKKIKFLLKEKGLTIKGAKMVLNNEKSGTLDGNLNLGLYNQNLKNTEIIKDKLKKISSIIKELKKYK